MDRRRFLRISGLLGLAGAFTAPAAAKALDGAAGRRVRITVVGCQCFPDLQSRYLDDPEAGPCTRFTPGQTFRTATAATLPPGFCPKAWECIRGHVGEVLDPAGALSCGRSTADSAVIACCSDGTRPVVFKIEPLA